jgi:hypothetical protein
MPGTNPDNGIPIPLDPDPVRDGAKAMRDIVSFVPYVWSVSSLFGSFQNAKPMLFYAPRIQQTSNQFGQLYIAFPKNLNMVVGAWITTQGPSAAALAYDIDLTNPPTAAGIIFRVMSPAGAVLPNRPCDVSILVIGQ